MKNKPDLLFGPDVATSGFTPAGIAAFSDLRPAAVVRELIQNSLDAALVEARQECARIRFHRVQVAAEEIPGLDSYQEAFNLAKDTQIQAGGGRMPTQAESVVDRISDALKDPHPEVLFVTDNGVGLDDRRMSALLSDGVSAKTAASAGTFGNGHSVAIPASDLRYMLYGGVVKNGRKLSAGHAIIASHNAEGEKHPRSAHGFYINDFLVSRNGSSHEYPSGSMVPPLVNRQIEWVRKNYGHGTVVVIPYFNNFQDPRSLWEMVSRAASCNFFQAIHDSQLVVEVIDETTVAEDDETDASKTKILDSRTLSSILDEYRGEKRIRHGAFLTGEKANEAYETLLRGELASVSTGSGNVSLRLQRGTGDHQVCLIRNGMWITDSLPELRKNSFTDRQPFRALLLLEPTNRNDLYELVQRSETPLHNNLAIKQLSKEDRGKLRGMLRKVRMWILKSVPAVESDAFNIAGLLDVQFDTAPPGQSGNLIPSFWGTPMARRSGRPSPYGEIGAFRTANETRDRSRQSGSADPKDPPVLSPSPVKVVSAPMGSKMQRIHIVPRFDCKNVRLRLFVDENIDLTCDRQRRGEAVPARLTGAAIDGKQLPDVLAQDSFGINLGDLHAGRELYIDASYEVTQDILMLPGQHPTLRVEIVQVRERKQRPTEASHTEGNGNA